MPVGELIKRERTGFFSGGGSAQWDPAAYCQCNVPRAVPQSICTRSSKAPFKGEGNFGFRSSSADVRRSQRVSLGRFKFIRCFLRTLFFRNPQVILLLSFVFLVHQNTLHATFSRARAVAKLACGDALHWKRMVIFAYSFSFLGSMGHPA